METVRVARNAMATRFEVVLQGADDASLRAAGEQALDEIEHWEARLSLYRASSEIARVNARAGSERVRVTPEVFALLHKAKELSRLTAGLFDITVGPLVRCWGFMGTSGRIPSDEEILATRSSVGMDYLELCQEDFSVQFKRPGMVVDLGAIGKGYALEQAVDLLRECGITQALIHGGTSTVFGLGQPFDAPDWRVAIEKPPDHTGIPAPLYTVGLKDMALSVSAVWGRCFERNQVSYGHVIHPGTGYPVKDRLLSAVVTPSATESDALSTALLTGGVDAFHQIASLRPGMGSLLVHGKSDDWQCLARNLSVPGATGST